MPQQRAQIRDRFAWQRDCMVAWICVLREEYYAAVDVLDDKYGLSTDLGIATGLDDRNVYCLGRIGDHNVAIHRPDGRTGQFRGLDIARDMMSTFPGIRVALIVGLGGGFPCAGTDIRLGDVVVSNKIIRYTSGSLMDTSFETTSAPIEPPEILLKAAADLDYHFKDSKSLRDHVSQAVATLSRQKRSDYARPELDQLFDSGFIHDASQCHCERTSPAISSHHVDRAGRDPHAVIQMHRGIVGSSDHVLRNARVRDELAKKKRIMCVEMEAAAVMHATKRFARSITVRGISDYADGHKNDNWHNYAALTAAVCAKALLNQIKPEDMARESRNLDGDTLERFVKGHISHLKAKEREQHEIVAAALQETVLLCAYINDVIKELKEQSNTNPADTDTVRKRLRAVERSGRVLKAHLTSLEQKLKPTPQTPTWRRLKQGAYQAVEDVDKMTRATKIMKTLILAGGMVGRVGKDHASPAVQYITTSVGHWAEVGRQALRFEKRRDRWRTMAVAGKVFIQLGTATGIQYIGRRGADLYEWANIVHRSEALRVMMDELLQEQLGRWGVQWAPSPAPSRVYDML
ncbi:hypothetical protein NLG97_g5565 [Lecanicillium saksenae]|uniref:Uncharacterized protein n=1 Tax=Lecanicillium saksenae TaxID=468837 RepID=A0ACC1QTU6_9HYPO|nr:hypothetical protein NLG97_g5565 [Lecanicillium saksenae]